MAVSKFDKEHLSPADQDRIAEVTAAAERGEMSWADAHSAAESIRSNAGYSGGRYGNEYNSNGSGSSSGSSGGSSGTRDYTGTTYQSNDYHTDAINAAKQGDWKKVLEALNNRDIVTGSLGTNYGKTSLDIYNELLEQYGGPESKLEQLLAQISKPVPSYTPGWGDQTYEKLLQQAIAMNYEDWTQSEQYKSLSDRYGSQGKMTMQDVLGQISSRTGGLASSYATTAANQQYNDFMGQLEEIARQMFAGERSDVIENAGLAREYGEQEYKRYLDELNQKNQQYSYALDIINQMIGYQTDKENTQYNRDQNTMAEAQDRIAAYLIEGGKIADLDQALIEASGLTAAELSAQENYYKNQNNESVTGIKKPNLTAAQVLKALEDGIVNDSTKAAYEYYFGQPWDDGEDDSAKKTTSTPTGGNYWLGDGSTSGGKTSLNYDEDEGIFTWNGNNYSSIEALEAALNSANLTEEEENAIKKKLSMFGFNS